MGVKNAVKILDNIILIMIKLASSKF